MADYADGTNMCQRCEGGGRILVTFPSVVGGSATGRWWIKCPDCKGAGKVAATKKAAER